MIVTVSGLSGLRNAYVSVLSAEGSSEIRGASRWLDAWAAEGLPPRDANATIMLEPGNYALLCFVDLPDRVPHVMKGMAKPLRVTPAAVPAADRGMAGDVTMTLNDYSFTLSKPITRGVHTIRVECIAKKDVTRFKRLCDEALESLQFH